MRKRLLGVGIVITVVFAALAVTAGFSDETLRIVMGFSPELVSTKEVLIREPLSVLSKARVATLNCG